MLKISKPTSDLSGCLARREDARHRSAGSSICRISENTEAGAVISYRTSSSTCVDNIDVAHGPCHKTLKSTPTSTSPHRHPEQ